MSFVPAEKVAADRLAIAIEPARSTWFLLEPRADTSHTR